MKRYWVEVSEVWKTSFLVEAESPEAAVEKVRHDKEDCLDQSEAQYDHDLDACAVEQVEESQP